MAPEVGAQTIHLLFQIVGHACGGIRARGPLPYNRKQGEPVIAPAEVNYLIYNPFAGKLQRNPGLMDRAIAELRKSLGQIELRPTFGPNSASTIAAECVKAGAARIIVAGGDGTINEAANGMIGSGIPMGILPGGTANVLAMELKIGGDPLKVARRFDEMDPVPLSTGVLHLPDLPPRHFLLMVGVGLDAAIVRLDVA